jgi:5-methylcytosine-specific restriction endonuclease McrA
MPRKRKIDKYSLSELQSIFDNACSMKEVIYDLGYNTSNNYNWIRDYAQEMGISFEKFKENEKERRRESIRGITSDHYTDEELYCENSRYNSTSLKNRIIRDKKLPYQCALCDIKNIWKGKPISLQLDHINGNSRDHRLENLRFLCPNCHSQTDTFAGKRSKGKSKRISRKRKFDPSKTELLKKLNELNWNFCAVGRYYDVSDNAIRKRCRVLKIDKQH